MEWNEIGVVYRLRRKFQGSPDIFSGQLRIGIQDLLGGIAVGNAAGNAADRHARSPDTRLTVGLWAVGRILDYQNPRPSDERW